MKSITEDYLSDIKIRQERECRVLKLKEPDWSIELPTIHTLSDLITLASPQQAQEYWKRKRLGIIPNDEISFGEYFGITNEN